MTMLAYLDESCIVVLLSTKQERARFRPDLCEREKADDQDDTEWLKKLPNSVKAMIIWRLQKVG